MYSLPHSQFYNDWFAPLNVDAMVCISGENLGRVDFDDYDTIVDEHGRKYLLGYVSAQFFNVFEPNGHYIYYGTIWEPRHDLPVLALDYCEPLD